MLGCVLLILVSSFCTLFILTTAVIFAFFQQWQLYRVLFFPFGSWLTLRLFLLCIDCFVVVWFLHQLL